MLKDLQCRGYVCESPSHKVIRHSIIFCSQKAVLKRRAVPLLARRSLVSDLSGFTLVELICVMVIVSLLAAIAIPRMMSPSVLALQSAKDQLLLSLSYAQQKALSAPYAVQLVTSSNLIDVRQDKNADGFFSESERVRVGGTTFPIALSAPLTLSSHTLLYNSLGETQPAQIQLYQDELKRSGAPKVIVTVSGSGFAQ